MNKLFLLPLLVICFSACDNKGNSEKACPVLFCPLISPGVPLVYVDKLDSPVVVKDFSVLDLRTNQLIKSSNTIDLKLGTYIIADYSDKSLLSSSGDELQVSATYPVTSQIKVVDVKVSGGTCSCDVGRLSGPDTVRFN
jgi:hypothetical protein